jgi:hypothetical protein
MGSLNNNAAALAAFTGQIYPNGLDLGRCVIHQDLGVFYADPAATILAGQLVTKTDDGIALPPTGVGILGVAKWNKANTLYGVVVDEPVVLPEATATALAHATVSNVKVADAANGGTAYTVTTDYTVNATNGTITSVAVGSGGSIADGATVYVTYTFELTSANLDFQGRNFWNYTDDVSIQDNHITVIVDWSILFTTRYDSSKVYTVTGADSNLYCGTSSKGGLGNFTNDATAGDFVGRVIQAPTATDPYLGVVCAGNPTINA